MTLPSSVVRSSLVLSLALMGDSLLYVVLPLYGAEYGLSLAAVGMALSLNRFVRILLYGAIAAAAARFGLRRLSLLATAGAILATLSFGVISGEPAFVAARSLWGLVFGALNLAALVYAVADAGNAARSVGYGRALIGIGPLLALSVGAWAVGEIGPRPVFLALTALSLPALWLAWGLPAHEAGERSRRRLWPGKPDRLDLFGLAMGFSLDGVFVMTLSLVLREALTLDGAVLATGLLFAARRIVEMLLAPVSGTLSERVGAGPLLVAAATATAFGCAALAADAVWLGGVTLTVARAILMVVCPVLVAARAGDRPGGGIAALAAFATWSDVGAALGPISAGWLLALTTPTALYAGLALLQTAALAWIWPLARLR